MSRDDRFALACVAVVAAATAWSAVAPVDRLTWALDAAPVLLCVPYLASVHRRLPLPPVVQALLAAYCVLLLLGAHWTFDEVPAGLAVKDALGLRRNPYDRLVHLCGGFVGAPLAREALRRGAGLARPRVLFWVSAAVVVATGAAYEILEWWAVRGFGTEAQEFAATQGDLWDPQWDLFLALVGAVLGQLAVGRAQQRQSAARGWTSA